MFHTSRKQRDIACVYLYYEIALFLILAGFLLFWLGAIEFLGIIVFLYLLSEHRNIFLFMIIIAFAIWQEIYNLFIVIFLLLTCVYLSDIAKKTVDNYLAHDHPFILLLRGFDGAGVVENGYLESHFPSPHADDVTDVIEDAARNYEKNHIANLINLFPDHAVVAITVSEDLSLPPSTTLTRLKSSNNDWKAVFSVLVESASGVVLFPGSSDGLLYEYNQISSMGIDNCFVFVRPRLTAKKLLPELEKIIRNGDSNMMPKFLDPKTSKLMFEWHDTSADSLVADLEKLGIDTDESSKPKLGLLKFQFPVSVQWFDATLPMNLQDRRYLPEKKKKNHDVPWQEGLNATSPILNDTLQQLSERGLVVSLYTDTEILEVQNDKK